MLANSATSRSFVLRGHNFAVGARDGGVYLPFFSRISVFLSLTRFCDVADGAKFNVSKILSIFDCLKRLTEPYYLKFWALASWLQRAERVFRSWRRHFCFLEGIASRRKVSFTKSLLTWLVVRTVRTYVQLYKFKVALAHETCRMSSGKKLYCKAFGFWTSKILVGCIIHRQHRVETQNKQRKGIQQSWLCRPV